MNTVETVRGAVEVTQLGPTLMHEHIFVLQPEALQNYGHVFGASYWDEEFRVVDAIGKLRAVRASGIQTIVDPTVPGLGRYIPRIQRVNAEVDLNIVVATGVYAFLELPNFLAYRSADAIAELFVREIREGIDDTGVKAAFLKCAVERHGIVGDVPKMLEAIAAAAVETGAPVMVHTNASREDRAARARGADERGRRPDAGRDRPRRRQQRSRVPPRDRRHRCGARLRPLRHRALQPGREAHRDAHRARGGGLRRPRPPRPRRRMLLRLHGRRPVLRGREAGLSPHLANDRPALLEAGVTQAADRPDDHREPASLLRDACGGDDAQAPSARSCAQLLAVEAAEHDAGVVPAEAERVGDGDPDVGLARLVRDVVEVAIGVGRSRS